ncbi:hypothetical protein DPK44_20190 [Salmonella enterica subsp. enterica serovar Abony]|nr:hypothetical protein [Salmonella enterica subsp. enterica serovar Richmond]EBW4542124.1 hypothetical protein [Salmonella enterica subsp. enterica serovar Abony]
MIYLFPLLKINIIIALTRNIMLNYSNNMSTQRRILTLDRKNAIHTIINTLSRHIFIISCFIQTV